MSQLVPVFLTIHILTAIVAFGPTFAFSLIARMAAQEPQNALFALRVTERIQRFIVIPAALTMPVSGALLVWSEEIDLPAAHWLLLSIALYAVTISFAILVQTRTLGRMVAVGSRLAAAGPMLAAGPGAALARPAVVAGVTSSPAAEMAALAARARNGGMLLLLMVVLIVSLMAGKPAI